MGFCVKNHASKIMTSRLTPPCKSQGTELKNANKFRSSRIHLLALSRTMAQECQQIYRLKGHASMHISRAIVQEWMPTNLYAQGSNLHANQGQELKNANKFACSTITPPCKSQGQELKNAHKCVCSCMLHSMPCSTLDPATSISTSEASSCMWLNGSQATEESVKGGPSTQPNP